MAKFYHIYITPKYGVSQDDIKQKMDKSLDWFRYDDDIYVVYSTSTVPKLTARFKPLVEPDGRLFICELNIKERNGWMSKSFWEWIKKDRNNNK